jgi:hypothetical protein
MSILELSKNIQKLSLVRGPLIGIWTPVMFTVRHLKIKCENNLDIWIRDKYKFMIILWSNRMDLIRLGYDDVPTDIILSYDVNEKAENDEKIFENETIRLRICGYNYHAIEFLYEYDLGDKLYYEWEILTTF